MSDADLERYRRHTSRASPTSVIVKEAWLLCVRRAGKSQNAALAAVVAGTRCDYRSRLGPGEQAVVAVLAADKTQAAQVTNYVKGIVECDTFRPYVRRILKHEIQLTTGVTIRVHA